jgi:hypothetical protein
MVGGIAVASAVRAWPFRVFSFPSEVRVPNLPIHHFSKVWYDEAAIKILERNLRFHALAWKYAKRF